MFFIFLSEVELLMSLCHHLLYVFWYTEEKATPAQLTYVKNSGQLE